MLEAPDSAGSVGIPAKAQRSLWKPRTLVRGAGPQAVRKRSAHPTGFSTGNCDRCAAAGQKIVNTKWLVKPRNTPITEPTSTSLRKCIPRMMRDAAISSATIIRHGSKKG